MTKFSSQSPYSYHKNSHQLEDRIQPLAWGREQQWRHGCWHGWLQILRRPCGSWWKETRRNCQSSPWFGTRKSSLCPVWSGTLCRTLHPATSLTSAVGHSCNTNQRRFSLSKAKVNSRYCSFAFRWALFYKCMKLWKSKTSWNLYHVKSRGSSILLKTLTWTKSFVVALIRGPGNFPLMVVTCSDKHCTVSVR